MPKTLLIFEDNARAKLLKGASILHEAVATTLGPRGRNVGIAKVSPYGEVYDRTTIHDGVNVAKTIDLLDEQENMGVAILREAAQKTVDQVGDGTTVTIVLAYAILEECLKLIASGVNPMELRSGLEDGVKRLTTELESYASPVKTLKEEQQIATISAEDTLLGELVAEVMHQMGPEGLVTAEKSNSSETYVKHQEGMVLDKGFAHQFFVTKPDLKEAVAEDPFLLVTDLEINTLIEMAPLLQELHTRQGTLVIISPSVGGEALPLLIENKLNGKLKCLAIQAPSYGDNQKGCLQDIATLTDARYITQDAGHKLADIKLEDLGRAEHVTSTKTDTLIVGGYGDKTSIDERKAMLQTLIDEEENEFDQIKLKERLAKLTNGVTVIYAGGQTEIEMNERKERIDDAIHATRAAMQKGIVPGGEIIYLRARAILTDSATDGILDRALAKPFNKLISNAGLDAGEIRSRLLHHQQKNPNFGYDVTDLEFKDLLKAGIIDPVLVSIKALTNAVSVAIALMTTAVLITPDPDDPFRRKL